MHDYQSKVPPPPNPAELRHSELWRQLTTNVGGSSSSAALFREEGASPDRGKKAPAGASRQSAKRDSVSRGGAGARPKLSRADSKASFTVVEGRQLAEAHGLK